MPIPVQVPIIEHVPNGVTTVFAYNFSILEAGDLKAKLDGSPFTAFTVSGVGSRTGGSITCTSAPTGASLILYRDISLSRATDYQELGDLLAETLDDDFDRVWMAVQDLGAVGDRSLRAPVGETFGDLPIAETRAERVLGFDSIGRPVMLTRTDDGGSALALDLASTAAGKGSSMIGFRQNYALAVSQLLTTPLSNIVSVSDYMTDQQVSDMHGGVVKPDITVAFQRAIDGFPRQGAPNWQQWKLLMPIGVATLSSKVSILNQQGGELHMGGCRLEGNFADVMLQIGDSSGSNDVLRFHLFGGAIIQNSTAAGSGAVKAVHNYSCSYNHMYIGGGRIPFQLDGNANTVNTCAFRGGQDSNVKTGAAANNEANRFLNCSNELSAGYGYDIGVTAGVGGFTVIDGGYCEANAGGNIYIKNSQKTRVRDVYFNLQNNASGIILDGTIGATYPEPLVNVTGCRVLGSGTGTPKFIQEISSSSINCAYSDNQLEGDACDMYGSATKSVNLTRYRKQPYITNATSIINTDATGPSDGWTLGGSGNVATVSSVSPFVNGSACSISTTNSYQYQQINVPAGSLIRVSVWAKCSGALANSALQLWSVGVGAQYKATNTTSTTATRLEIYLTPAERASATSFLILLRNTGSGDNAQFCDVEIEDMTV